MDSNLSVGKKAKGKPKGKWVDRVKNGFEKKGLSGQGATDRVFWKRLTSTPRRWKKTKRH